MVQVWLVAFKEGFTSFTVKASLGIERGSWIDDFDLVDVEGEV
jgi:uncharacterized membrane protein